MRFTLFFYFNTCTKYYIYCIEGVYFFFVCNVSPWLQTGTHHRICTPQFYLLSALPYFYRIFFNVFYLYISYSLICVYERDFHIWCTGYMYTIIFRLVCTTKIVYKECNYYLHRENYGEFSPLTSQLFRFQFYPQSVIFVWTSFNLKFIWS